MTRDHDELQLQILAALADGPKAKWELRTALHVEERILYGQLRMLRARGAVKVVGRRLVARQWALVTWQPPAHPKGQAPRHPNAETAIRMPKPTPAKDSWWTRPDLSRAAFQERARRGAGRD